MIRIPRRWLLFAFAAVLAPQALFSQTPDLQKNYVTNGGFENSVRQENLWDGVDSTSYLCGNRGQVPVLTSSGAIAPSPMPLSVGIADMDSDGVLDILTMDVLGYLRIYFNSGTPQQPKFTTGELGDIFLTRIGPKDPILGGKEFPGARLAPRIFPTNIQKTGKMDLLVGNYLGEILLAPNSGTPQRPYFKQPPDIGKLAISTTKNPLQRWGNVFAPCTWDWNQDGRDDLLIGEGSYSANNIHLLSNVGYAAKPVFNEDNHFILAYGDGLEQLTPHVVDFNGDGLPDLLVAERSGKIAVYLNKGEKAAPGEPPPELPFASFLTDTKDAPLSFGGICTVTSGDLNGDGLFDLVIGKSSGRIALALNKGSKTEPHFDSPVELKGEQASRPFNIPSGWEIDYGLRRGNFYGFISTVKADQDDKALPVEGLSCLKVGYMPSLNKVMPFPTSYTPAFSDPEVANKISVYGPARYFSLRQDLRTRLKMNKNYTVSFRVKGRVTDAQFVITWSGGKKLSEDKVVRGDRNSAEVIRNVVQDSKSENIRFSGTPVWTEVRKTFRVTLKEELKDLPDAGAELAFNFSLSPADTLYFDDLKIVESP